jgi:hypothetical protein
VNAARPFPRWTISGRSCRAKSGGGKYKDQPVEVLTADPQYREWLMGQHWFQTRFPRKRRLAQIL